MFEISVELPRNDRGDVVTHKLKVPALPRPGDYMSHEDLGFAGYVRDQIDFWWDANSKLTITVKIN